MKDPYWYILALVCGLFIFTPGHIGIVAAPFIILAACLCLEVVLSGEKDGELGSRLAKEETLIVMGKHVVVTGKVILVGRSRYSFRRDEAAYVIGVSSVIPEGHTARPCFCVQYGDGFIDYVPIESVINGEAELQCVKE